MSKSKKPGRKIFNLGGMRYFFEARTNKFCYFVPTEKQDFLFVPIEAKDEFVSLLEYLGNVKCIYYERCIHNF